MSCDLLLGHSDIRELGHCLVIGAWDLVILFSARFSLCKTARSCYS